MRHCGYIFLLFVVANSLSCGHSDEYAAKARSIDSLNGSLQSVTSMLVKTDTAMTEKAVTKYRYYLQFIQQNVTDTLTKAEADQLQKFLMAGRALEDFSDNRKTLLARASLIGSQLRNLSADIRKEKVGLAVLHDFCSNEMQAAGDVVSLGHAHQKLFLMAVEDYKNSVKGVEQIIRARNHGELPFIVKDEGSL